MNVFEYSYEFIKDGIPIYLELQIDFDISGEHIVATLHDPGEHPVVVIDGPEEWEFKDTETNEYKKLPKWAIDFINKDKKFINEVEKDIEKFAEKSGLI